jgi:hypothetical protein
VPLHPVGPNPYTLLAQIPPDTQYYSVLDLKDAFFCIPLHPDSQLLFDFEDLTKPAGKLTWMVLPQGFWDSPHIFGQILAWTGTPRGLFYSNTWMIFSFVIQWNPLFLGPQSPY